MTMLAAGVVLGLGGSLHCVAMCGPLIVALAPRGGRAVCYHAGRAASYLAIGALAGGLGAGIAVAGGGRWLAFVMAAGIGMHAVLRLGAGVSSAVPRWAVRLWHAASRPIHALAARHPSAGAFGLGAANGLLPCGLVYAALAAAAGFGDLGSAMTFTTGFAIGTMPVAATGLVPIAWARRRAPALARLTPVALILLALLLVARGLDGTAVHHHVH